MENASLFAFQLEVKRDRQANHNNILYAAIAIVTASRAA